MVADVAEFSAAEGLDPGTAASLFATLGELLGGDALDADAANDAGYEWAGSSRADAFADAVDGLADSLGNGLVEGEYATAFDRGNMAMRAEKLSAADAAGKTVSASANGSSVSLPAAWAAKGTAADVSVTEYFGDDPRPRLPMNASAPAVVASAIVSNVVRVRAVFSERDDGTARRLEEDAAGDGAAAAAPGVYELVLLADPAAGTPADWAFVVVVNCSSDGDGAKCPGKTADETRAAACAGGGRSGLANASCVGETTRACVRYVNGEADWDGWACEIRSFGAMNATCACSDDAREADYGTLSTQRAYARYYDDAFAGGLSPSLLEDASPLLRLAGAFAGFWAAAGLLGVWLDAREDARRSGAPAARRSGRACPTSCRASRPRRGAGPRPRGASTS